MGIKQLRKDVNGMKWGRAWASKRAPRMSGCCNRSTRAGAEASVRTGQARPINERGTYSPVIVVPRKLFLIFQLATLPCQLQINLSPIRASSFWLV